MKHTPVTLVIIGAGARGSGYAGFAKAHPDRLNIVGVAEPRTEYRQHMADEYSIPPERCFTDWREVCSVPKFADAVVIATQDTMHLEPAVACADLGYHMLLEKPMAPNEPDCERIVEAVQRNHVMMAVGHVMRYSDYSVALKRELDSGIIGQIMSIEHLEPVGYWHQAHSYVRGNWRNSAESSSMLLAKSCHDLDWLRYMVGKPCTSVSSFGSLTHFRRESKPAEAGNAVRCIDCSFERRCPYSAVKIYLSRVNEGHTGWPVDVLTPDPTPETVQTAIESGPYGRCVYECDNDVVDHQVVAMEFEGETTASFTMTAFTEASHRKTRVFGTKGMIEGDGTVIRRLDFLTDEWSEIDTTVPVEPAAEGTSISTGHGGADYRLMTAFVDALASNDASCILSGPEESLETHRMVFRAERARLERRIVNIG